MESTDSSNNSETSDPGGAAAPGVFVQLGLRNADTISTPTKGITLVGRENDINVHAGQEPIQISVSSQHKDVEAGAANNIIRTNEGPTMSSFPTCQICNQQFSLKGPAPFLLPCLHPVCETCVTSADGGVLTCGPCERDVNLTETPLQKDEVREKQILHLTVKLHPEQVLCTNEEDDNQAVCWCKDCKLFFCKTCQNVHRKFKIAKQHNVYDIEALKVGDVNEDKFCTVHPKLLADKWDSDCSMLTCQKCRRVDHSGHEDVDAEEAAKTARNELSKYWNEIQHSVDHHKANLAAAEKDATYADEESSTLDGRICFTFNTLKGQLEQREKVLREALKTHRRNVSGELDNRKKKSETCHQICQTTSDYFKTTLEYSSLYDILELKQLLEEKYKDCRRSAPTEDYKSLPLPVFNTDGLDRIKVTLARFGAIATDDEVPTNQMKDYGTQTDEDVVKELEKLTQKLKLVKNSERKLSMEMEQLERDKERMEKESCEYSEKITRLKQEADRIAEWKRLRTLTLDDSFLLSCANIKFSMTKFNSDKVQINTEVMINNPQPNLPYSDQRLKRYWGTSSTDPLPQCGSPQYFEVESQVGIEKTLTGNTLLLEIGLAREEEQDQRHSIDGQPHSYSLDIVHCTTHRSICSMVWRHGKHLTCLSGALENTPDTKATLHYGVVYDSARNRIAFLDVKNEKIIGRIANVDSSVALWPMFGVFDPNKVSVRMSLVVGNAIKMTDKKRKLILDCLTASNFSFEGFEVFQFR